jgi:hypothetical protein
MTTPFECAEFPVRSVDFGAATQYADGHLTVNLDENVRKILEITRLDHSFECCDDLIAALKTMRWQRAQGR